MVARKIRDMKDNKSPRVEGRSMLLHFESKLALFCDRIQPRTSVYMPICGIPFESYFQQAVL